MNKVQLTEYTRQTLIRFIKELAVTHGEFTLKNGDKSSFYIDLRRLSLDSMGLGCLGSTVESVLEIEGIYWDAVAGPALGACPIIGGMLSWCDEIGRHALGFMVRSQAKEHGTGKLVEGQTEKLPGREVVVVEDVVTTGGSVIAAAKEIEALGGKVTAVVGVLDREQGGRENIVAAGYRYVPIVKLSELNL